MVTLKKPMKAPTKGVTDEQLKNMKYPIACSAKLDGIRAEVLDHGVMSATLKRLANQYMQWSLLDPLLVGLDGELVVGKPYRDINDPDDDVFNRTSGAIRSYKGRPDFKFYVFDDFTHKDWSYRNRWIGCFKSNQMLVQNPFVVFLEQKICKTYTEAQAYEKKLIGQGYEGMMARTLDSPYKEGRVTLNEGYIFKRKPLEQSEGIVIDIYEQQKNDNPSILDALGNRSRSSHVGNKTGKGTLGGVVLLDPIWNEPFRCGIIKGATKEWRKKMWDNPDLIMGATMTYTYQGYGSINAPRIPIGKVEFRPNSDITKY